MAFNDTSYIQTYDFNTQAVYPLVGIGSIVTEDVGVGSLSDDAATRINNFKSFINDTSVKYADKAGSVAIADKANAFADNINAGTNDSFAYIEGGKPIASNASIGNESQPVYIKNGQFLPCKEIGNTYKLPEATADILGGIKTGYAESGKNYKVQLDRTGNAYVYVPWKSGESGSSVTIPNANVNLEYEGKHNILTADGTTLTLNMPGKPSVSVSNEDTTLEYSKRKKIASVAGTDIYVTMPAGATGGEADGNATYAIERSGTKITLKGYNGGEDSSINISSCFDDYAKTTDIPTNYVKTDLASTKNQTIGGTLTAEDFITTSDERIKTFFQDIPVDFDKLKNIPKKYFTFNDDVNKIRIGTSAQKLKEVYPELVSYDEDADRYAVSYANISIVALAAIDKLHEEIKILKNKINELENGRS